MVNHLTLHSRVLVAACRHLLAARALRPAAAGGGVSRASFGSCVALTGLDLPDGAAGVAFRVQQFATVDGVSVRPLHFLRLAALLRRPAGSGVAGASAGLPQPAAPVVRDATVVSVAAHGARMFVLVRGGAVVSVAGGSGAQPASRPILPGAFIGVHERLHTPSPPPSVPTPLTHPTRCPSSGGGLGPRRARPRGRPPAGRRPRRCRRAADAC